MAYSDRFIPTNDLITHLTPATSTITDAAILANYAGFLSVSVVTVYELAIKDIFNDFAVNKGASFGHFVSKHFERINGRIKLDDLKKHIGQFGDKYLTRFKKKLDDAESTFFASNRVSVKQFYVNVINCRHEFVHAGSPTLTINEVMNHYNFGKEVIHVLYNTMQR